MEKYQELVRFRTDAAAPWRPLRVRDPCMPLFGIRGGNKSEDPGQATTPLFCSLGRKRQLTDRRLHRREALAMIKRRARQAGLSTKICNHTGRATGITNFLLNGGSLEDAQRIAGHASAKTTKGYDHTDKALSQTEIERIDYFRKPAGTASTSDA